MDSPAPLLCRDEWEHWSPAEAHIFAEALEKCNKDFHEIRQNYLPWKSAKDIVEYYYMYKTSDRYAKDRKPKKASLNCGNLKRVYILPYNKPSSSLIPDLSSAIGADKITSLIPCESCTGNESNNWYKWGPVEQKMRLCQNCWTYWKKRGGLKLPHESERYHFEPLSITIKPTTFLNLQQPQSSNAVSIFGINGENNNCVAFIPPIVSRNPADKRFYFRSTILHKLIRKLAPKNLFNPHKFGRSPFRNLNTKAVMDNFFDRDPVSIIHTIRKNFGRNVKVSPSFIELIAKHCRTTLPASR